MSTHGKRLQGLKDSGNTFPWKEVESIMRSLGYEQQEMAGSRVRFFHPRTRHIFRMHRPHPSNVIKNAALRELKSELMKEGHL